MYIAKLLTLKALNQMQICLLASCSVFLLCRFAGAIPEVANSRLAMLGVLAALAAEFTTGLNVFEQFKAAPLPIILTFAVK